MWDGERLAEKDGKRERRECFREVLNILVCFGFLFFKQCFTLAQGGSKVLRAALCCSWAVSGPCTHEAGSGASACVGGREALVG